MERHENADNGERGALQINVVESENNVLLSGTRARTGRKVVPF